jgi:hypothetical protein
MTIQAREKETQRMAPFGVVCSRATAMSVGVCMVVVLGIVAPAQAGSTFSVTNLITNNQAVNPAQITDPNLVNPWGVSFSPTSPLWVSNNGTGLSSLYTITPSNQVSIVTGPDFPVTIQGGAPTGTVFNGSSTAFNGDPFLFVTLNGAVEGWRPALGNTAELLSPTEISSHGSAPGDRSTNRGDWPSRRHRSAPSPAICWWVARVTGRSASSTQPPTPPLAH